MDNTKEQPGPLDGLERAKPNEPIFTLQGGDPQAPGLILLWVSNRREEALKIPGEKLREAELRRCTLAEQVAWSMVEYQKGHVVEEQAELVHDTIEAENLHRARIHHYRALEDAVSKIVAAQQFCYEQNWIETAIALEELKGNLGLTVNFLRPHRTN